MPVFQALLCLVSPGSSRKRVRREDKLFSIVNPTYYLSRQWGRDSVTEATVVIRLYRGERIEKMLHSFSFLNEREAFSVLYFGVYTMNFVVLYIRVHAD